MFSGLRSRMRGEENLSENIFILGIPSIYKLAFMEKGVSF